MAQQLMTICIANKNPTTCMNTYFIIRKLLHTKCYDRSSKNLAKAYTKTLELITKPLKKNIFCPQMQKYKNKFSIPYKTYTINWLQFNHCCLLQDMFKFVLHCYRFIITQLFFFDFQCSIKTD